VFVIVLGIVLYNPKDIILEAKDKAEAIQQEYVTMLRYTDSRRAQVYRPSQGSGIQTVAILYRQLTALFKDLYLFYPDIAIDI
jgi:hypothetical protein